MLMLDQSGMILILVSTVIVPMTGDWHLPHFLQKDVRTHHPKSKSVPRESKKSYFFNHNKDSILHYLPLSFGCRRVFIVSGARSHLC